METKTAIGTLSIQIDSLKGKYPLDTNAIINKQVELEAYKDGLTRIEALNVELFG